MHVFLAQCAVSRSFMGLFEGSEDRGEGWGHMRKVSSQIFSRKIFNSLPLSMPWREESRGLFASLAQLPPSFPRMQEVFVEKAEVLRRFLQRSRDLGTQVDLQSCPWAASCTSFPVAILFSNLGSASRGAVAFCLSPLRVYWFVGSTQLHCLGSLVRHA